jgi:hydrogenase-4 component B
LQSTQEHDLEKMGGLIRKMPYTALFFLIGCISISALPPFNGFVSEWLTFQTALQTAVLKSVVLRALIPIASALLALTGALAVACFVKLYAVAFLGQSRTESINKAKDVTLSMITAMAFLAILCLLFGIFPSSAINFINYIPMDLLGFGLVNKQNWFWLIPFSASTASYNALFVFIALIMIGFFTYCLLKICYRNARHSINKPWDCGFGGINARMQYTGTAFAMPIRRVFENIWLIDEKIDQVNAEKHYSLHVKDLFWKYLYEPLEPYILHVGRYVARIQGGKVRVYLAYMFFTLIILLGIILYI